MNVGCDVESLLSRAHNAIKRSEQLNQARKAQQPQPAQGGQQAGCGQQQDQAQAQRQPASPEMQASSRQCAAGCEQNARNSVERNQDAPQCSARPRRGLGACSPQQEEEAPANGAAEAQRNGSAEMGRNVEACQPREEVNNQRGSALRGSDLRRPGQAQQAEPMRDGPQQTQQQRTLRRGARGEDVRDLQRQLNQRGARLAEDGRFGPRTDAALRRFQRENGVRGDGVAGPRTREALERNNGTRNVDRTDRTGRTDRTDRTSRTDEPQPRRAGDPPNRSATFDRVANRGARNQMVTGRITVNGNTYDFRSGGHQRGNLPRGDYTISNLRNTRQAGMVRDGVGFKADMSDKYDPRVGGTRSALRIHPDGGSAGTAGCIGIVGDRATLERFRRDLATELQRNGGRFTLRVG
jgi:peptidoglycan hydrolase-like protein with peptidoglycan-binding domain